MMPENRQKEMYERAGNHYLTWVSSAGNSIAAARVLKKAYTPCMDLEVDDPIPDEMRLLQSMFLLYGFGLECLFKALWLKNGNTLVSLEKSKYIGIRGVGDHKLHDLADATSFQIDQTERDTLVSISTIMTSTGRYPIPKNFSDGKIKRHRSGGYGSPLTLHGKYVDIAGQLIDRLVKQFGCESI